VFWFICKAIYRACCKQANAIYRKKNGADHPYLEKRSQQKQEDLVEDPAKPEEMVPMWWWAPLLVLVIILICVVMGVQYDMPIGMSLLSVLLAFVFTFLAIQCTGVTDITPLTAASKASQVVLGGATKAEGWAPVDAQRLNLLGGAIANMGANQACDLVGDFRVGFLLRTSPKQQWLAQGLGTIVACFLAPALFILFAKAYPCILDTEALTCTFSAPSVAAWRAVAVAVTADTFPVPNSSGIFSIVFAIFGGAMTVFRELGYKGKWAKYRVYHPNFMVIGLSFTLIQTYYGTALCIGAIPSYFWMKKNPKSFDIYGEYLIASNTFDVRISTNSSSQATPSLLVSLLAKELVALSTLSSRSPVSPVRTLTVPPLPARLACVKPTKPDRQSVELRLVKVANILDRVLIKAQTRLQTAPDFTYIIIANIPIRSLYKLVRCPSPDFLQNRIRAHLQQLLRKLPPQLDSLRFADHLILTFRLNHLLPVGTDDRRLQHQRLALPRCLHADRSTTPTLQCLEQTPLSTARQSRRSVRQHTQKLKRPLIPSPNLQAQRTLPRRIQNPVFGR
jgi:hypothetical protein